MGQGELLVTQHPAGPGHGSAARLHRDLPALVAHAVTPQEQMHPCFLCWWPWLLSWVPFSSGEVRAISETEARK